MGEYADYEIDRMIDGHESWGPNRGWPTGQPVNKELAAARIRAHNAFDPIWQSGEMTRSEAYQWLADQLGIPKYKCHMKKMNIKRCRRVEEICTQRGFADL